MKQVFSTILRTLVVFVALGFAVSLNVRDWNGKQEIALPLRGTYGAPVISKDLMLRRETVPYLEYKAFQDSAFSKLAVFYTEMEVQFLGTVQEKNSVGLQQPRVYRSSVFSAGMFQKIVRVEYKLDGVLTIIPPNRDIPFRVLAISLQKNSELLAIFGIGIILVGIAVARVVSIALDS